MNEDSMSSDSIELNAFNNNNDGEINTGSNNKFPMVYCNENEEDTTSNESMEGMLFSDLKKALSTLSSMSIEDESSIEEVQQQKVVELRMVTT